ncbi:MAG TPA: SpoIID/LytB domain-containing protein [Thermoanaerobaculia bacterium]|nr:SpoIID/LytB domain-containing protein [Thermoanaerobaculia bacterium]
MKKTSAIVLLALALGCRTAPPPVQKTPPPPAPPVETPAPVEPAPTPEPTPAPPEPEPRPGPEAPLSIRVGLASDLETVTLPCCEEALAAAVETRQVPVSSTLRVEPAAGGARKGFFRLQIAALRDERQAQDLARRLAEETGQPGEATFDAGIDLYRVRVGHYATREEAERDLRRLGSIGVIGGFVVNDGGGVSEPAIRLTQGGISSVQPGRWLTVTRAEGDGIRVNGKRYRGRILIYLNDRGLLNLINDVPVEQYLRGVVPSEMGPELYNQLEALKAQAVAARTYTLRNLGEFAREGYDICATPRCQVYNGMGVEHPLSDRAISETAGQVVIYQGRLADTLYSSTCGGHTEDVHVVFPLKQEPYLQAVPCMEEGAMRLAGSLPPGQPFPQGLTEQILPPAAGRPEPEILQARLEHLALLAGLPVPRESLGSTDRREVQRFVASAFDLVLDASVLVAPADVSYLLHDPPRGWSQEDLRRAAYLIKSGLITGPLDQPLEKEETERMLLALAEMLQVVRREEVAFLGLKDSNLRVKPTAKDSQEAVHPVSGRIPTFRRRGELMTSASSLALVPGDRLTLYWQADRLIAAAQEVDLDGVAFDRSSPYSSWTRFRTDSQLARNVDTRFPGIGFRDLEILDRGESGRVGKIRILGDNGQSVEVDGLPIRWTLDVPDTLFTAKRLEPKNREAGWLFTGRGFGHGVGMCQVGSYGMAQRGHSYRDILTHYYTGAELGKVRWTGGAVGAAAAGK